MSTQKRGGKNKRGQSPFYFSRKTMKGGRILILGPKTTNRRERKGRGRVSRREDDSGMPANQPLADSRTSQYLRHDKLREIEQKIEVLRGSKKGKRIGVGKAARTAAWWQRYTDNHPVYMAATAIQREIETRGCKVGVLKP